MTAVEWLFEKLWQLPKDKFTWYNVLEQAKQMEKEQMEISDEEIEKRVKEVGAMGEFYKMGYRDAIIWYREQLKSNQ